MKILLSSEFTICITLMGLSSLGCLMVNQKQATTMIPYRRALYNITII